MGRQIWKSLVEYVREAVGAVIAFLGGVVVFLSTLGLNWIERRFGLVVPSEVTIAGGVILMIWGQFWAYHKLRLKTVALMRFREPEFDSRLEPLGYKVRLQPASEDDTRGLAIDPDPSHLLEVTAGVLEELRAENVLAECTDAIYSVGVVWRSPDGEQLFSIEATHVSPERVIIPIPLDPLPCRSIFQLHLGVNGEARLLKLAIKPPASPPSSKG
ncbi:MAG: hypothetical protein SX243_00435 [Acidobacteriota bacterium]|nr:hypothetical protein [Acidobacteriota bacterium]